MTEPNDFDRIVGKIAGSIFSDVSTQFPHPPLLLVAPLTFKVKKLLEQEPDLSFLSDERKNELAEKIRLSIVPVMFSFDFEADMIQDIAPIIESSARKALDENFSHTN